MCIAQIETFMREGGDDKMETREMTQQVINFQKQILDNWDAAAVLVENQATSTVNWMFDTAVWMPAEGRQAMEQWMTIVKEERGRLKAQFDQGLAAAEKILAPAKAPAKPKTTATKKQKGEGDPQ
jgi:hypothetical protein